MAARTSTRRTRRMPGYENLAPLSHEERRLLRNARRFAKIMDTRFGVGPLRFGADAVIGLIPGLGDLATASAAGYLVLVATRLGVPPRELAKMVVNIGVDLGLGFIPILGDIGDLAFRANTRNLKIIEEHIRRRASVIDAEAEVL